MAGRDVENLLDLPLRRAIWRLALPAAGALALRMVSGNIDQFWVGHLPDRTTSLAAVGAANFVVWMVYAFGAFFTTGIQATVARAVGAGDRDLHAQAVYHGTRLALACGLLVGLGGALLAPWILRFQDLSVEAREAGIVYLRILFCGLPLNYLGLAFGTCFRAEGDTVTPFRILVVGPIFSFLLDGLVITRFGVPGVALVNLTIQLVQATLLILFYARGHRHARVALEPSWFWRLARIGYPLAGAGVLFSSVYVVLVKVLSPYGDAPVAALTLGHTIEGLTHFLSVGFGTAAATLVGQNLGAGRPEEARRAAFATASMLAWLATPLMLLLALCSRFILGLYMNPDDPEVISLASQYLWVIACGEVAMAYEIVMWNAQAGAGSTWPPTCIDLIVFPSRIPLAYLMAQRLGLGPLGVWLAIGVTAALGGVLQTLLFRSGRWARQQV